jgi:hypothetical protein
MAQRALLLDPAQARRNFWPNGLPTYLRQGYALHHIEYSQFHLKVTQLQI